MVPVRDRENVRNGNVLKSHAMTDQEQQRRRKQLHDLLVSGEIDQTAYEQMLAEVERLTGEVGNADLRYDTLGGVPTNVAREVLAAGSVLGPYAIESLLGRGGMGEVWKAYNATEERHVVVKVVPPEIQHHEEEVLRLKESFKVIHALQHPHICPVYVLAEDPRVGLYLVMRYIDGVTLSKYRRQYVAEHGHLPLEEVCRLLHPVAEALDHAHCRKVIHRDVKPQNILVDNEGNAQVIDFGIAAQIHTSMTRVSREQFDTSGTAPYMPPEQWRGHGVDGRSDQYALGVVAYELLAGRLPFEIPDLGILRHCVIHEDAQPLEDQPEHVNGALLRALAKKREDRFGCCVDFLASLQQSAPHRAKPAPLRVDPPKGASGVNRSEAAGGNRPAGVPQPTKGPTNRGLPGASNVPPTVEPEIVSAAVASGSSPFAARPAATTTIVDDQSQRPTAGGPRHYCIHCGHPCHEAAVFCPSCGGRLKGAPFRQSPVPARPGWTAANAAGLVTTELIVISIAVAVAACATELIVGFAVQENPADWWRKPENGVALPTTVGTLVWGMAGGGVAIITTVVAAARIDRFSVLSVFFWLGTTSLLFAVAGGIPAFVQSVDSPYEIDHVFTVLYGTAIVGVGSVAMILYQLGLARFSPGRGAGNPITAAAAVCAVLLGLTVPWLEIGAGALAAYGRIDDLQALAESD